MSSIGNLNIQSGGGKFSVKNILNNNMVIVIAVIVLILLAGLGYKLSSNFMGTNNTSISNLSKTTSPEFRIVTPQCVFGALKNSESKVLVVNVLSDKMPIFIGVEGPDEQRSISKLAFETLLSQNNNSVPKDVEMVILMCAGWSCSAGKSYFEDLVSRGVDVSKVVDYAGGIHEWCTYSKLNNSVFKVFNMRLPENTNVVELSSEELVALMRGTAHSYKNNTIVESKEMPLAKFCGLGSEMPNLLN